MLFNSVKLFLIIFVLLFSLIEGIYIVPLVALITIAMAVGLHFILGYNPHKQRDHNANS